MPRQTFFSAQAASPDELRLRRFEYREELGRLFRLEAELLSDRADVNFDTLVGEPASVALMLPDGSYRHFCGIVNEFAQDEVQGRFVRYRATLVPWLWLLTRTADCRIFQGKSVPEIVKGIFQEHGMSDHRFQLQGSYDPREYCVQYRESDFQFVSRLLEEEGIYYFWKHEEARHELVLVDTAASHEPFPGFDRLAYRPAHAGTTEGLFISEWRFRRHIESAIVAHTDFNFEKPGASLLAKSTISRGHAGPPWEIFDYPGEYLETPAGERYARVRIEERQSRYEVVTGRTEARGLSAGCVFDLERHPRDDQNRRYLLLGTSCVADCEEHESATGCLENLICQFEAIPAAEQYRPARLTPRPVVQGPQTAIVVGPSGEEIYVDKYGRVKVHFHWDRAGRPDQNASCWIRVSQGWAGKAWGAMQIPRIGQEVIVEFLEGDPDRPIITGRVYNAEAVPPYELPANQTVSTVKSLSSKGGDGFNEIRFEDKKGSEQLFLHAERNHDIRVKNDAIEWIGNDRHLVVKHNQVEHIENNRQETVDADHAEKIGKDRHLQVVGKEAKAVDGSQSLTVKGDVIEVFKSNHSEQTSQDYYLKATNLVIEGSTHITLKVGSSHVVLEAGGIKIGTSGELKVECTGPGSVKATAPLTLESSATADLKSPLTSVKGDGMVVVQGGLVKIN